MQCDLLRALRLPALLVGDGRLGGISATLCAHETLVARGYDVPLVALLDADPGLGNAAAIQRHLGPRSRVLALPLCPPPPPHGQQQQHLDASLVSWLEHSRPRFAEAADLLREWHATRLAALRGMAGEARRTLWWPFTQHAHIGSDAAVTVIDARVGESFAVFQPSSSGSTTSSQHIDRSGTELGSAGPALATLQDACASWWTQGVGSAAAPELARAAASAAGRYGHVMFPENVHAPALELARTLLGGVGAGWAARVFYSDNGSTAVEVALKMAFRKYMADAGLLDRDDVQLQARGKRACGAQQQRLPLHAARPHIFKDTCPSRATLPRLAPPQAQSDPHAPHHPLQPPCTQVVGLREAYHGDTLGAMEAVAPSPFTGRLQTPWYSGRGLFLDPPTAALEGGAWRLCLPAALGDEPGAAAVAAAAEEVLTCVEQLFAPERWRSPLAGVYAACIEGAIAEHELAHPAAALGAAILEPVLQGAGGMRLIDPLFQREMVLACRWGARGGGRARGGGGGQLRGPCTSFWS